MAGTRVIQGSRRFGRRIGRAAVAVAVASASMAALVALDVAPAAAGVDRWVSTTGNDNVPAGNTCINQATPCRTINRAFTVAAATDVIKIAAGTYNERLLNVNKVVTFEGLGGQATTIVTATGAPQGAGTVFTVTANPVTIKGLTIRNGVGGVFATGGGKVILQDSTVTNNTGTTVGAGVIVNVAPSEAELSNTTVQNNTANNGAGILTLGGKVTITGGAVQNNTTTAIGGNPNTGFGGGIFSGSTVAPAGLTLTNVTVSGNRAQATGTTPGTGGGIYNAGTAVVQGSTISGNQAAPVGNTAGNGGGLNNSGTGLVNGTTTLTNTTVTNNTASNGAGIMNLSLLAAGSKVVLNGGQVTNNTATAIAGNTNTGFGGGIYSLAVGALPLSVSGTTISGNRAQATGTTIGTGGGVYTATPAQITGATISSNNATNGGGVFGASATNIGTSTISGNGAAVVAGVTASGQGGGLHVPSTGNTTTTGSSFTTNTAANGAGIYSTGRISATGGAVSDNTATANGASTGAGGGIYSVSSASPSLTLDGMGISGNKAVGAGGVAGQGGGIFHFTGTATLQNTTISGNSATGGYGGGLESIDSTVTMTGGSITDNTITPTAGNTSTGWGGGVFNGPLFAPNATLNLTGVEISGNQALTNGATGGSGGGLAVTGTATINTSEIAGNTAARSGGGLLIAKLFSANTPTASLDHTDVTGNTSTGENGGGIHNAGSLSATDLEISDNTATASGSGVGLGAGVFNAGSTATLARVTLAGNHAQAGSALTSGGPATLRNSTVNGNVSDGVFGSVFTTAALTLSNDTIAGNTAAAGGAGGVVVFSGTTTVDGSIVAQNGGNCAGTVGDGGYNLTDTTGTSSSCAFTNNAVIGDPQLNALGDNNGPTRTMLPKNNSPAINKIPPGPVCPSIDQRGVSRPQGTNCDIGSVELEGITAPTLNGPDHALFVVGTPDSVGFTYSGIPTPTLSTTGDALPAGVTLTDDNNGNATLGGTAAAGTAGVYEFTIKAANGESPDATIDFTLTVIDPLVITTTSLPDGEVNVPYNATVQATGGTTPYTWSIDSGSLPAGLSLNSATGAITGTPSGPEGSSTFTVKVTDSTAVDEEVQTATKQLTISIKAATSLQVDPAILRISFPSLRLSLINASARLTKAPGNTPVAGQTIRFTAGSQPLCTAVTDANGFAKCPPVTLGGIFAVVLAGGYDAHFDGTATLKPSTGHGQLVSG